jgi:hypothetical protein
VAAFRAQAISMATKKQNKKRTSTTGGGAQHAALSSEWQDMKRDSDRRVRAARKRANEIDVSLSCRRQHRFIPIPTMFVIMPQGNWTNVLPHSMPDGDNWAADAWEVVHTLDDVEERLELFSIQPTRAEATALAAAFRVGGIEAVMTMREAQRKKAPRK